MSKSKLIVIAATVLVVVATAVIVLAIVRSKKTVPPSNSGVTDEVPSVFTVSVDQQNGAYTATITAAGLAQVINEPELFKYVVVSFNSPIDIMRVSCASGYVAQTPRSATGNPVVTDPDIGSSIELFSNKNNNLSLTCAKK